MKRIGVVAIGRNEGERLRRCLQSVVGHCNVISVVYVDSGSTDGSVDLARSLSVEVLELDLAIPFTAARARNAGLHHLLHHCPEVEYVQFVDGDCEILDGWLERAADELDAHPQAAVAYGRRAERYRDRSLYNRLCDMEWHNLLHHAGTCGGDALMRVKAVQEVGGFNAALIAGEEPDLCLRLRQAGWSLLPISVPMTLHDAQMLSFQQWWRRNLRSGHAYAEGAWMHSGESERHWFKETASIWFWGVLLPLLAIAFLKPTYGLSLVCLFAYPLLVIRITRWMHGQGFSRWEALMYGVFCVAGKWPNLLGQCTFYWNRLLHKPNQLIEYK